MKIGDKVSARYPTPENEYEVVSGKIVAINKTAVFLEQKWPKRKHYVVKPENIIKKENTSE
jgi:hypothetical protein